MYSYPVSTAANEMAFIYILPVNVITRKTNLYKAKLSNSVIKLDLAEKDLDVRQLFYPNQYLFLCGTKIDMSFII